MRHIQRITIAKAEEKQGDVAGQIFFQLWLTVFTFILSGAFGTKD